MVVDYKRKFSQLSRYTPYQVDIEERKARQFVRGLHREIVNILASLELPTYAEVNRHAQAISTSIGLETAT